MGIADAGTAMTLHSAALATILIARAFTGHLLLLARKKPANPELAWMVSRTPAGGRSRSVEARHTATLRPARLLGANRGLDAHLSGGGSYEGQRRCAFLLYRQENISERTPHLLERTVLCKLYNDSGRSEVGVRTHTNKLVA